MENEPYIRNYKYILEKFNGDKEATKECLRNMCWLISDIEIFKGIDLDVYNNIWKKALEYAYKQ